MANITTPKTHEDLETYVPKLKKELNRIFSASSSGDATVYAPLIDAFAFYTGTLYVLQAEIQANGILVPHQYTGGAVEMRRSAAYDTFLTAVKTYATVVKQLASAVPDAAAQEELKQFLADFG